MSSRLQVALRIVGADLDPDEMTKRLGVAPTSNHRRGEVLRRGSHEHQAVTGHWGFSLGTEHTETWNLDAALNATLDYLPAGAALWQDLGDRFQVDLFCGLFMGSSNQGTDIESATLARIATLGLAISFDVYGP